MIREAFAYQEKLLEFFGNTKKTGWGKNEICFKLLELYGEFATAWIEEVIGKAEGKETK